LIKKFKDIADNLELMRNTGNPIGDRTGFDDLDKIYTIKQGSFTFILAAPHHGKSEFAFELAFNQAFKYGKKCLIYSPETGSVEDIYAEFIHKYTGRPFYKSIPGSVEDKEYYNAINYIDQMFNVVDSDDKSYSIPEIMSLVRDEKLIITDPYNELRHEMGNYNGRQDLYIEDIIGEVRRFCKKFQKHWIISLHPAAQQIQKDDKGNSYYGMPMAREAAGGQALLRKAMTWINMWRPPLGMNDQNGMPYEDNIVLIKVEKAKPKGVAMKGEIKLFFDWKKNRYYQFPKIYAFEYEK
jgi:hypothetical protein